MSQSQRPTEKEREILNLLMHGIRRHYTLHKTIINTLDKTYTLHRHILYETILYIRHNVLRLSQF